MPRPPRIPELKWPDVVIAASFWDGPLMADERDRLCRLARVPEKMDRTIPLLRRMAERHWARVNELVGRRIKIERVYAGLRQIDLAAAIGISQPRLSRIERGITPATAGEIIRLAVQLKVTPAYLLRPARDREDSGWEIQRFHFGHVRSMDHFDRLLRSNALPEEHPIYD